MCHHLLFTQLHTPVETMATSRHHTLTKEAGSGSPWENGFWFQTSSSSPKQLNPWPLLFLLSYPSWTDLVTHWSLPRNPELTLASSDLLTSSHPCWRAPSSESTCSLIVAAPLSGSLGQDFRAEDSTPLNVSKEHICSCSLIRMGVCMRLCNPSFSRCRDKS